MDATPVTLGQEFGGYAAHGRATASSGSRPSLPRRRASCRWAARRSAPASTPRPASPRAVIAALAERHRAAVHRGAQPLRGAGHPGLAGRAVRRSCAPSPSASPRSATTCAGWLGPARRARRDPPARPAAGVEHHARQGQPGAARGDADGLRPGDRQRRDDRRSPARRGSFELNVMMPVIAPQPAGVDPAARQRLAGCSPTGASTASPPTSSGCASYAESSPSVVTPLNRYIGYEAAAKVAKQALAERSDDPRDRDRPGLRRARRAHRGAARRGPRRGSMTHPDRRRRPPAAEAPRP